MSRNSIFIILATIGILLCLGGLYYVFLYEQPESDSRLGIVYNPAHQNYSRSQYEANIKDLEDRNIGVVQLYTTWVDTEVKPGEYDWVLIDEEIKQFAKEGWRVSLAVPIVEGHKFEQFFNDYGFIDFYDSSFRQKYRDFLLATIKRYKNEIDYLEVGNDIDRYLLLDPREIDGLVEFYNYIYQEIKKENPNLLVGTVFSYDNLKNSGNLNVFLRDLPIERDFLGFSYYNIDNNYRTNNIDVVDRDFEEMIRYSGDSKLALISTGLSSSSDFNSSELKQKMFIEKSLKFVEENKKSIEFVNYNNFKNPTKEYCLARAEERLWKQVRNSSNCQILTCEKSTIPSSEKDRLADFLCSFGLKWSLAWNEGFK